MDHKARIFLGVVKDRRETRAWCDRYVNPQSQARPVGCGIMPYLMKRGESEHLLSTAVAIFHPEWVFQQGKCVFGYKPWIRACT